MAKMVYIPTLLLGVAGYKQPLAASPFISIQTKQASDQPAQQATNQQVVLILNGSAAQLHARLAL